MVLLTGDKMIKLQKILYETDRKVEGLCSIEGMNITTANLEVGYYSGQISCRDHLERCEWADQWEALKHSKNVYELSERRYGLMIKPKIRNALTGDFDFTLLQEFNRKIEHSIAQCILEFNPKLPSLDKM